jgi:hypothetical protein
VYLCLPGLSRSTWMQSHPFAISWWYKNKDGDDVAVFMIKPRKEFTRRVEDIAPQPPTDWMTLARIIEELQLESHLTHISEELNLARRTERIEEVRALAERLEEVKALIRDLYGGQLNLESARSQQLKALVINIYGTELRLESYIYT